MIGINMELDIAFPYKPPPENTKKSMSTFLIYKNHQKLDF